MAFIYFNISDCKNNPPFYYYSIITTPENSFPAKSFKAKSALIRL